MQKFGIHHLDWPARSPDLNPIEYVWFVLKRRVRSAKHQELKRVIAEEWEHIHQNVTLHFTHISLYDYTKSNN